MEGTTHYINIDCIDKKSGIGYNLTGYKAVFSIRKDKNVAIHKDTEIHDNTVSAKLDPSDSIGQSVIFYECRIFAPNGDVYHVIYGHINVVKAHVLLTEYPREG